MPKGFESYKNGLIFGVLFGLLVMYASINISALSFINSLMNSITDWLIEQTWMSWASFMFDYLNYVLAALIGGIIGIWIDLK